MQSVMVSSAEQQLLLIIGKNGLWAARNFYRIAAL
jgi:hypothetical protein